MECKINGGSRWEDGILEVFGTLPKRLTSRFNVGSDYTLTIRGGYDLKCHIFINKKGVIMWKVSMYLKNPNMMDLKVYTKWIHEAIKLTK